MNAVTLKGEVRMVIAALSGRNVAKKPTMAPLPQCPYSSHQKVSILQLSQNSSKKK